MHRFQLNALCLVLFGSVAIAGEADPSLPQTAAPQAWQTQEQYRPYYPQQGFAPPRGQASRYRPMETHPAAPPQYDEYPANRDSAPYSYPEHYPQQEYYPAYPPADNSGNSYYYPATPGYGQGYVDPQPYSYPYVYEQAPDYGGYPAQPGYDYQPGYQQGGYYPQPQQPAPGADYGESYAPPAYDYPASEYPPNGYPQQPAAQGYPPAAATGWSAPRGQEYAPPPSPRNYPVTPPANNDEGYAAGALQPEQQWPANGQPTSPVAPAPGQASGYMVNGEPAVFRPWSEPTTDTLTAQPGQPPASE